LTEHFGFLFPTHYYNSHNVHDFKVLQGSVETQCR